MNKVLVTERISPAFFDMRDDTVCAWLGMAGVLLNVRGTILLIDPLITMDYATGRGLCEADYLLKLPLPIEAKDLPRLDALLYTHADNDHFGRLTAQAIIDRFPCALIATPPVQRILSGMGAVEERAITVIDFASLQIGCVEIIVTPALHDWQEKDAWQRGDCCGYVLKTPDGTLWHPGDTRLIDDLLGIKNVDVLFFDVAAVDSHLGPAGSARLAASCGAKVLIPYHYGTFDLPPGGFASQSPEDSLPYITGLPAEFRQVNPGQLVKLPLG